jgi:hypothetical protein
MEISAPAPVDISRLKGILGNAKKVMKATDERFPNKAIKQSVNESHYNSGPIYNESDEKDMDFGGYPDHPQGGQTINVSDYTEEQVLNSKLPQAIKEAMLKNHIPKLGGLPSKFSLEDLSDLVEKPNQRPKTQINEVRTPQGNMITISVEQLNEMIDNRVNKILVNMFAKNVTEQTIKKTVTTLVNEGKLTLKKK